MARAPSIGKAAQIRTIIVDQNGKPVRGAVAMLPYHDGKQMQQLRMPAANSKGNATIKLPQSRFNVVRGNYKPQEVTVISDRAALPVKKTRRIRNNAETLIVEITVLVKEPELQTQSVIRDQNGKAVANAVAILAYTEKDKNTALALPRTDANGLTTVTLPLSRFDALRKTYKSATIKQGRKALRVTASRKTTNNARLLVIEHTVFIEEPIREIRKITVFVTDQNGNTVPGARVSLRYKAASGEAEYQMPVCNDVGTATVNMPDDDYLPVRKYYIKPPKVELNGIALEVLKSSRSPNTRKMMRVSVNVAIPVKKEDPTPPPKPQDTGPEIVIDIPPPIDDGPDDVPSVPADTPLDQNTIEDEPAPTPPPSALEKKMNSKTAKRLFRFNAIRPVVPQQDNEKGIEYTGELTPLLKRLQALTDNIQARSFAADEITKYDFFKADRFENTKFWPLISSMKRAYNLRKVSDIDEIRSELADAFADYTTPGQLEGFVKNKGDIWDHYILSLLNHRVSDKKRAALVDCIKAVELLRRKERIRTSTDFIKLLLKSPILPAWLVKLVAADFRDRFPFVIGITDLMVVKEDPIGYERAEIAHIENVMATEERITTKRQLDRTETTTTYETERIKETMKETSTSIHSAMSQEIEASISQTAGLSTGATVSASYGPAVSVDTNASFDFTTASEETASSAQEYAQDIVERAVATVSNRERNETITVVLSESEDTDVQTFSNIAPGAEHVIGVYRNIDQIWKAQVFNYGKRLMLDIVVPEPSLNWRLSRDEDSLPDQKLKEPEKLDIDPKTIDMGRYQNLANIWGATNVPAPPDSMVSVSKTVELEIPKFGTAEASSVSMASAQLQIPDGYRGTEARVDFFGDSKKENNDSKDDAKIVINGTERDIESSSSTISLNNHVGTLEFAVYIDFFEGGVASVKVICEVSPETWANWQNNVYDALKAANDKAIDAYNAARKNKEALRDMEQENLHPDIKNNIEKMELKRSVVSMLTMDNYEDSGSVDLEEVGDLKYPSVRFQEARKEGAYARFFEEAFEWQEMTYLYYPYFWARREEWFKLMNQRDPDYNFNAFVQSGAARVNLAVRPGFEAAVMWFLATGEVWKGGPTPMVGDPLYIALIDEIVENKGRDLDKPTPVGEPWTYSIPTSLVVLDPDDSAVPPPDETED